MFFSFTEKIRVIRVIRGFNSFLVSSYYLLPFRRLHSRHSI
jgi:hypothetical protein